MIYEILKMFCEALAKHLHTIVECKNYEDYGWASFVFMTDKFGGTYANFHYDLKTNVMTYNFGCDDSQVITDTAEFYKIVKSRRDHMLEVRDMSELSEFINSQYY